MPIPSTLRLRWNILKLRISTTAASVSLRMLLRKKKKTFTQEEEHSSQHTRALVPAGLSICALTVVAAMVLSVMSQGAPRLRGLGGVALPLEDVILLDPNQKDLTNLSPGYLYNRPVAVMQTGRNQVLVRARVEETL
ncbi:MAG: hypothetical protein LBB50_05565, partial [Oscillospiraceae bacterium]|nr:hypothetical protein [Oscillospiraceae bacterium]